MADDEPRVSHEEEDEDVQTQANPISQSFIGPLVEFYKDSSNLLAKCNKPDRKEFLRVLYATGIGFAVMGAIGFGVKLIHIPINHLLVG